MQNILMPIVDEAKKGLDALIAEVKAGYEAVKDVIKAVPHAMMVAAAQSTFGTTMANLISELWDKTATGSDKMKALVAAALPFAKSLLDGLSWTGVFSMVEDFIRAVAEMMFPTIAKRLRELATA